MGNIQSLIDALQDAIADEYGLIRVTDEARCAMVRILMKSAEPLKEKEAVKPQNLPKIHELKILQEYFDAVKWGDKKFEIRKNDRDFHSGDILRLKEWDGKKFTGEELYVLVRYVMYGTGEFGLDEGYCIMSIDVA